MPNNEFVELPLNSEEKAFIMEVLRYLTVELNGTIGTESNILNILETSRFKCVPRGVLATMIIHGYAKTDGDKIRLIINEKGGENMDKIEQLGCCDALKKELKTVASNIVEDYSTRMTPGEEKVAKAVINHFGPGFEIKNPSRALFEVCLVEAFPKIKNGKAATTNLINKKWLKEVDGKIFIGPEGEKYLSP